MKLNHLNLSVPDVPTASRFFHEYFGFAGNDTRASDTLAVLHDDDGFALVLSNFNKKVRPEYPEGFHIGFIQSSKEQVDAMFQQLNAAGYAHEAPRNFHGSWTFYFRGPGEILIEVLY